MHDNISSHPLTEANENQIKMCFQVSRLIKKRICFPNIKLIEQLLSVQKRNVYIVRYLSVRHHRFEDLPLKDFNSVSNVACIVI